MSGQKEKSRFPLLISIVLVVLLTQSIISTSRFKKSINRLDKIKLEVEKETKKNIELKKEIEYVQSDEYLEKAALEYLNKTKPGYTIIIINEKTPEDASTNTNEKKVLSNWQMWLKVFNLNWEPK